jgi:hypothetical protein
MIVEITIRKEDGTLVTEMIRSALGPFTWKCNPDTPEREVSQDFGEYKFFGFTFQPHVMLTGKSGGF